MIVMSYEDGSGEIIGPFPTFEDVRAWEDRKLDAPEGARAEFVPLLTPSAFVERGKFVVKASE